MSKRQRILAAVLVAPNLMAAGLTAGAAHAASPKAAAAVAAAAPLGAQEGVAKVYISTLAPIKLPEGTYRSLSTEDVAKFEEALQKIATAGGGKLGDVEVLVWPENGNAHRKTVEGTLKSGGYTYVAEDALEAEGAKMTPFGAVKDKTSGKGLVGMWIENEGLVLLAWGTFRRGDAPAEDAEKPTEILPSHPDPAPAKPAPAKKTAAAARPAPGKGGIPGDLIGSWEWTTISGVNYQDMNTGRLMEPSGMATKFTFTKDGHFKFFFYVRQRTYNLVTQSTTTSEGTVKFNGDGTFTLYPEKGHYKGNTGSRVIDRPMTAEERKPTTYAYEWRNENGKRELYVAPGKQRSDNMSRFRPAK
jgi:hypothetical protein